MFLVTFNFLYLIKCCDASMDVSPENQPSSDILDPDLLDSDQDAFDSLEIAINEILIQESVQQLTASVQDPQHSQIQELVLHSSEASIVPNGRERTREAGELNFDVLMKRCEDDMELVIAVLVAFCSQGTTSCSALELAIETMDESRLSLEAVCSISIPIPFIITKQLQKEQLTRELNTHNTDLDSYGLEVCRTIQ